MPFATIIEIESQRKARYYTAVVRRRDEALETLHILQNEIFDNVNQKFPQFEMIRFTLDDLKLAHSQYVNESSLLIEIIDNEKLKNDELRTFQSNLVQSSNYINQSDAFLENWHTVPNTPSTLHQYSDLQRSVNASKRRIYTNLLAFT